MNMRRTTDKLATQAHPGRAFTLIELLVVISIIALLVGILLPALGSARKSAQSIVCAGNQRSVGQAMMTYTTDGKDLFPPSYVYPYDNQGNWRWQDQVDSNPFNRYLHWSYMVYGKESGGDDAFTCPNLDSGGMPRTYPGEDRDDWQTAPDNPVDLQAARMAYAGNAALIPRNKFNTQSRRKNQLVNVTQVRQSSGTILAAEYSENTNLIRDNTESKSHRPIQGLTANGNMNAHLEPDSSFGRGRWTYGWSENILQDYDAILAQTTGSMSGISGGGPNVNAVGRHHSGGGGGGGKGGEGGGNFLYADGHVDRDTVLNTLEERKWGDRMYSVTGGDTQVYDFKQ